MSNRVRITGIGGVFFKARDPVALAAWYREQLGVDVAPGETHAMVGGAPDGPATSEPAALVWSAFPADTPYFGTGAAGWMVNYRVANLDAMLDQLRASGAWVSERIEASDFGRFGWATDPEGTRFELWEPPRPDAPDIADSAAASERPAVETPTPG